MGSNSNEIQQAIQSAFDLGWQVGKHEEQNNPISSEQLHTNCAHEFKERDRLIQKFADHYSPILIEAIDEALRIIKNDAINGFRLDPAWGVTPEQFLSQAIWSEIINQMATANDSSTINKEVCEEWLGNCMECKVINELNLKALCSVCHLKYDAKLHAQNASATRLKKRKNQEQLNLLSIQH